MHVAYYVTGHGFGHGVRTAAICNALSPDVRVTFKTALPRNFFEEELRRPFGYLPAAFDCGCVQNDSMSIDKRRTLDTYRAIARQNDLKFTGEVSWCRQQGVDVVVSDITSCAFEIAFRAGIPSVGVSNFTWWDIYNEYLSLFPEYAADLAAIRGHYARATLMCALAPALPMPYFSRLQDIPAMVGRQGRNRREEIFARFSLDPAKHLGLIYFGHYGVKDIDFGKLERFSDWEFIGVCALNGGARNYRCISKSDFKYQDLVASADVMICKLGYGAVSECMIHGTPMVYLPRRDFAEYPALDAAVRAWGGGHFLMEDAFLSLSWEPALDCIIADGPPEKVSSEGAVWCARAIEQLARG